MPYATWLASPPGARRKSGPAQTNSSRSNSTTWERAASLGLAAADCATALVRRFQPVSVVSSLKTGAEMARLHNARLYNINQPTLSRILAEHRLSPT